MLRFPRLHLAIAIAATALFAPLSAFADAPVHVTLRARHVGVVNGKEVFTSAEKARPGDVIEYQVTCRNGSSAPVRQVMATLPLPEGIEYVAASAMPVPMEASLDGRTFEPVPIVRRSRGADGREIVREVPPSQYRGLRWQLGALQGGAARTVTARARIAPLQTASLVR